MALEALDEDEKCLSNAEAFSGGGFRKWVTAEVLPALHHASAANPIEEKSLRSLLGALTPIEINHWNASSSALQFGLQCIGMTVPMHWKAYCNRIDPAIALGIGAPGRRFAGSLASLSNSVAPSLGRSHHNHGANNAYP